MSEKDAELAYEEAEKLFKLKSKFIINIKSFFLIDLILYIVMDFADGGDLFNVIVSRRAKKQPFEEKEILTFVE